MKRSFIFDNRIVDIRKSSEYLRLIAFAVAGTKTVCECKKQYAREERTTGCRHLLICYK